MLLGVGFIIGSGIFLLPITMAGLAGTFSLVSWTIAGLYTIFTGLCFAENAGRIPRAGGLYSYAHEALGEIPGFITGWSFWTGYWITIATETVGASLYLKFFLANVPDLVRLVIATIVTLILLVVNYRGVKLGGMVGDAFTVGKIIPLLVFVVVGFFLVQTQNYYPLAPADVSLVPAVGSAAIFALWAYLGVEIITVPEEEIKDAKHTVPRAILISVFVVMAIYLLVAGVALGLARWDNYLGAQAPLADIFRDATSKYIGNAGGALLAVGGLISIIGSANAVTLGAGRISYAMARDKLLPKGLNHLNEKFKTPDRAMILQTVLALALTYTVTDFKSLASLAVMFTIVPYTFSSLATIKLIKDARWKTHVLRTRFTPFVAVGFSLILLFYVEVKVLLLGAGFILVGFAIFLVERFLKSRHIKASSLGEGIIST